jgi:alpha-ribazole phosphatase
VISPDLWWVRHAPVVVRGVCYGQSDVATTLDARGAADVVERELDGVRPAPALECLWTSPWERTRRVADEVGARRGLPVRVDARLSELSFGEWEGRTYAELEANDGARYAAWMAAWEIAAPPGGERVEDLVARVAAWARDQRGPALVLTHAGPIRTLRALARGLPYARLAGDPVPHLRVESARAFAL